MSGPPRRAAGAPGKALGARLRGRHVFLGIAGFLLLFAVGLGLAPRPEPPWYVYVDIDGGVSRDTGTGLVVPTSWTATTTDSDHVLIRRGGGDRILGWLRPADRGEWRCRAIGDSMFVGARLARQYERERDR